MNEAEKRSNLLGLIVLFVVFTSLGILLSFFYVIFQTTAEGIWANIIAPFVIGGVLAGVAWLCKRFMKITNNAMSVIVVAIGTLIILFVMWNMWFTVVEDHARYSWGFLQNPRGIRDIGVVFANTREMIFGDESFLDVLREVNSYGTWTLDGTQWYGLRLWAVWGAEALIILAIPLLAAYSSAGLFILELNVWVNERLMNYGFTVFEAYELDRIASGDIDVILEKPLEAKGGPMSAVAVCYHKDESTDFIAIYNAHWDKEGVLAKGRHIMTVNLGAEKIDVLDAGLQAKHYPAMAKKETPTSSEDELATDDRSLIDSRTDSETNNDIEAINTDDANLESSKDIDISQSDADTPE